MESMQEGSGSASAARSSYNGEDWVQPGAHESWIPHE